MAEYGAWNQKGATLSDVTARKEYGISREFILEGIRLQKLEFREGSVHGNPYFRILRRQLETWIAEKMGKSSLDIKSTEAALKKVKTAINSCKRKLKSLETQKLELESKLRESASSRN